jgi:hypothetical protein
MKTWIVIYMPSTKQGWIPTRKGDKRAPFYTASQRPVEFKDRRTAERFMLKASSYARSVLNWTKTIWDCVPMADWIRFQKP